MRALAATSSQDAQRRRIVEEQPDRPAAEEYADSIEEVLGNEAPKDRRREAIDREYGQALEDIRELLEADRELKYAEALHGALFRFFVGANAAVRDQANREQQATQARVDELRPRVEELRRQYAVQLRRLLFLGVIKDSVDDES
jgi:hypothetical protein